MEYKSKVAIQGAFYIPAKKKGSPEQEKNLSQLGLGKNISQIQAFDQSTNIIGNSSNVYQIQMKNDDTILDIFSNLDKDEVLSLPSD